MDNKIENCAINSERWLSLKDFDGEVWKDIPDYEGLYQASNKGRIKSLDRFVSFKNRNLKECKIFKKGRIVAPATNNQYLYCHLSNHGRKKIVKNHRLVALLFIDNPCNYEEVNHKNEIKTDNRVENLEWCDRKYNHDYGTALLRISKHGRNHPRKSHPVHQFTKHGLYIASYPSIKEAKRQTGIHTNSITKCANGDKRFVTAKGFIWTYSKDEYIVKEAVKRATYINSYPRKRRVNQYTIDGILINTFSSIRDASKATGVNEGSIGFCCRHYNGRVTAGGYKWEFSTDK